MLELHPDGLSANSGEGPLPERPLLAPWLRRAQTDDTLLLEYGDEVVAVEGATSVLPLLDGTHLLADLEPGQLAAVAALAAEGVVVPGPAVVDEDALREASLARVAPAVAAKRLAAASVVLAGDGALADEVFRLLPGRVRRVGWDGTPRGADLAVAAPAPRDLPLLAGWNERCLASGTPWLLVLPFTGRFAAVGPLFVPDETCCYRCFVRRRASALPDPADVLALELAPASYPLGRGLAAALAGLAAVAAARWLVRGDGALAGAFFALELDEGPRLTRHRVLRVPRCEACSPARGEPPLVPWASGVRR